VNLPFKSIWNSHFTFESPDKEKPFCFVLFDNRLSMVRDGFVDFLKRKHPTCKAVLVLVDTVGKCLPRQGFRDICEIRRYFDAILTFNPIDAETFNLTPFVTVMERVVVPESQSEIESDVFFVGYAKDRLNTLHELYSQLTVRGCLCDFTIVGVKKRDRLYPGINYSGGVPHSLALEKTLRSNCVLDISQQGSSGWAFRIAEAILYNRKIITNNSTIAQSPFFDPRFIYILGQSDADLYEFAKKRLTVDYAYENQYSGAHFLQLIEGALQESGVK
jgi:hypothetical protein